MLEVYCPFIAAQASRSVLTTGQPYRCFFQLQVAQKFYSNSQYKKMNSSCLSRSLIVSNGFVRGRYIGNSRAHVYPQPRHHITQFSALKTWPLLSKSRDPKKFHKFMYTGAVVVQNTMEKYPTSPYVASAS